MRAIPSSCGLGTARWGLTTLPAGCSQAAYGLDHVWVLCNAANTAKVLRVDPATAQVDAQTGVLPGGPVYTFVAGSEGVWLGANTGILQVDPSGTRLTALTVTGSAKYLSSGSIWMLAPLGGNEIVRISTTSGNPVGRVYPGGSCSQYCTQVYAIAGAVWEPTAQQIIRIDPTRMPG